MFVHFGHRWVALNRGPMWQYDENEDLMENENVPSCDIVAKALNSAGILDVGNVLAVASDAIEGFDTGSVVQSAKCSEVLLSDVLAKAGIGCEGSTSVTTVWTSITREYQVVVSDAVEGFDARSVVQSAECSEVLLGYDVV